MNPHDDDLSLTEKDFKASPRTHAHRPHHRKHFKSYFYFFLTLKPGLKVARPILLPLIGVVIIWLLSMWVVMKVVPHGKHPQLQHSNGASNSAATSLDLNNSP
ncbi:MAG: hypothetical protein ABI254_03955 [Chthoniobacterales bacterium]